VSSITVLTPGRRGGRPRTATPLSAISTRLPVQQHDQLVKQAQARGISVSELVRQIILSHRR